MHRMKHFVSTTLSLFVFQQQPILYTYHSMIENPSIALHTRWYSFPYQSFEIHVNFDLNE